MCGSVPAGAKSAYRAADQWNTFTNIEEPTLSLSAATAGIGDAANSTATVDVISNTAWSASSNQSWLTISPASGTGNITLTFTAAANTASATRTATVTVSATGLTDQTITVTQAAAQDNALNFDGTDDYVNCGIYNPVTYTIEAWVNPTVVKADQAIVSTLSEVTITGSELHIGPDGIPVFTVRNAAGWTGAKGAVPISASAWTHLAATYDGATVNLYVNGVLSGTTVAGICIPGSGEMHIGKRSVGVSGWYHFSGTIDEVRVWSTARTVDQIAGNMYNAIDNPATVTGLARYFTFNQGTAGGSNSGITTLTDASASVKNGTLNNFALEGSASNWIKGYHEFSLSSATAGIGAAANSTATVYVTSNTTWSAISDQSWLAIDPASATCNGTVTFTATANTLKIARTATVTFLATGLANQTVTVTQDESAEAAALSLSDATVSIGAAISTTDATVTSNTTWTTTSNQTWLAVSPSSGIGDGTLNFTATANPLAATRTATITVSATGADSQTITVTQAAAPNNALNFDGVSNYVNCDIFNPDVFTIEAWVNPNALNADQAVVSTLSTMANEGSELHIGSDGIPIFTVRNASGWADTKGTVPVSANTWTHLAATFDGTTVKLYVNGYLSASSTPGSYTKGSSEMHIGGRSSYGSFFNGVIDEVSVWNSALTESQIAGNMFTGIDNPATVTGLTRYFTFNQGTAGESNSAITYLTDASASAKNGTLNSFVLTGSTSNWVTGYIPAVLSVSALTASIGETEGSTTTVNVASNLAWTAVSDQSWLTVSPASGTGNGSLTFNAAKNTTVVPRIATVTISATGVPSQTITVTQQGTTTGIDVDSAETLRLYPNPATDQFRIEGVNAGSALKLFDINGKLLISVESYDGSSVPISNLQCGIYFVKVKGKIFRFVKQ